MHKNPQIKMSKVIYGSPYEILNHICRLKYQVCTPLPVLDPVAQC